LRRFDVNRVKVINQDITGTVVEDWGNKVVIIDDDAETLDDRLEFKKSEVVLVNTCNKT
jgi:hypothetical protein